VARTPGQRGKIGSWLVDSRLERGWTSQARAREEIERLTGWQVPQSVYAEWESGRRIPSDANLERLEQFYGPIPGQQEKPASEGGLVAAVRDQTAVLSEVLTELRRERAQRDLALGRLAWMMGMIANAAGVQLPASLEETPAETEPEDPVGIAPVGQRAESAPTGT